MIILTTLNPEISCFENSIDPDQLAPKRPADLDQHCFLLFLYIMLITGII